MPVTTFYRTIGSLVAAVGGAALLTATVQTAPTGQAGSAATASPSPGRAEPLFAQATRAVPRPRSEFDKHTLRRGTLKVSEKALAAGAVLNAEVQVMNLFPDVEIVALRRRVESRPGGDYSWFGDVADDEAGRAIVTVVGGKLAAVVTLTGRRFLVLPVDDGTHDVLEIDTSSFPENDDTTVLPGKPADVVRGRGRVAAAATNVDAGGLIRAWDWTIGQTNFDFGALTRPKDPGSTIDVMVVYSHRAECGLRVFQACSPWESPHDDPQQVPVWVQLALDLANQSFVDSGIPTHLTVVGDMWEVHDFEEGNSLAGDNATIRNGHVANVHYQRELRAADIVVLITNGPDACGMSPILGNGGGPEGAYVVVDLFCLVGDYTLAHEIGHQFGVAHDWATFHVQGGGPIVKRYAHGYISLRPNDSGGVRTIMAYGAPCAWSGHSCAQIGRWSDPNASVNGLVLGVAHDNIEPEPAHDQRLLIENLGTVAQFRDSICRIIPSC